MAPPLAVMELSNDVKGNKAARFTEGGLPLKASRRNSAGVRVVAAAVRLALSAWEAEKARMRDRLSESQASRAFELLPKFTFWLAATAL